MGSVSRLVNPGSVALIGASGDPKKTAALPLLYLRKHGYTGRIYPVNPRLESIDGLRCYPDIASLPETPDVGMVLLNAAQAHKAVRELAARGTKASIVLASGYSETGEDGRMRERQLMDAAGTMRLLGPNTIGLINLSDRVVLSASGSLALEEFPVGTTGIVSQSGGMLGALLSHAAARSIGLSRLISTGNETDLGLEDCVAYLADDPATQVIALYIEAIRQPSKFRSAAARAARAGKPIVAFKIGRSEAGAVAAMSHTGALSGADSVYDALFRQLGIIRAPTFGDLLNISVALSTGRNLNGKRVAVLTSTGGAGTLVADGLGVAGFEIPAPDEETRKRLQALHSGNEAELGRNPIDVTLAGLKPDLLNKVIACLLDSSGYDALVVIVGSSALSMPELMADAIRKCLPGSEKPVIAFVSPYAPQIVAALTGRGIPAYTAAESCAAALDAMLRSARRNVAEFTQPGQVSGLPVDCPSGVLDETAAKTLFSRFGIPSVREFVVASPEEAELAARQLGPTVALKILMDGVVHKSDIGGVELGIRPGEVAGRMTDLTERAEAFAGQRPDRFVVQEMVSGGVELILGCRRDPLGTVLLLGAGGLNVELFKDTSTRLLLPDRELRRGDALGMAQELKIWPLLDGYRGRPASDIDALVSAIVSFSRMAVSMGHRMVQAEINPLFVLPAGSGVIAGDGLAVFVDRTVPEG